MSETRVEYHVLNAEEVAAVKLLGERGYEVYKVNAGKAVVTAERNAAQIIVRDGCDLLVMAVLPEPTLNDPVGSVGGVARSFRVVANKDRSGLLLLVPISDAATFGQNRKGFE